MLIAQAVDAGHTQVLVWRLQETEGSFCKGRRGFIFYNKSEVILWIMITMVLINYLILVGNPFFFLFQILELSANFVMVNAGDDDEPSEEVYKPDGGYIPR